MPDNVDKWAEARRKALAYANSLTPEEDTRIEAAAEGDLNNRPYTDEEWARANFLPHEQHQERMKRLRGQRGRQKAPAKKLVSLRLDPDVLEHFRETGPGWQARINTALRKAAGLA
ncbi:MAG: BrnA antitoxin family protein [Hyphomicrobiaceae bacterium]|nr:BrnA antitoxin family protein [Hyphomicrobiaceae bacterium]